MSVLNFVDSIYGFDAPDFLWFPVKYAFYKNYQKWPEIFCKSFTGDRSA